MKSSLGWIMAAALGVAGCSNQASDTKPGTTPTAARRSDGTSVVTLTPENSKIVFVGTHAAERPDPRTGGFEKFTGEAELDADAKALKSVSVDIDTSSIWTQFPQLTTHLNSPDFFDTREHPTATFKSTKIEGTGEDVTITGDLTLLGTTKEVSFPAKVAVKDDDLSLEAEFPINRSDFGMDKLKDRVEETVTLSVAIGEKTEPLPMVASIGPRGPGGGPGGPGGGTFDPAAFFSRMDADGNGSISGDEIPDRMRSNLSDIDTDGDSEISKEEFLASAERMRGARGGAGGKGRPGGGGGFGGDPAAAFNRFDADANGSIAGDEISDSVRENLDELDADKDGAVSRDEFFTGVARMQRAQSGPPTAAPAQQPSPDNRAPAERPGPEAFFARFDSNGDGKLTGSEIQPPLSFHMKSLDKDADGVITREEMAAGFASSDEEDQDEDAESAADSETAEKEPADEPAPDTEPAKDEPADESTDEPKDEPKDE